MYNLIFGPALFYDIPEYLSIVWSHTFWQVFSLGHFPIHPIFLGILWLLIRIVPVNVVAMIFGILSIFLVYKISKLIFKKGWYFLPAAIFALLPGIWLINTNLVVESTTLTFFLASAYFFLQKKPTGFFVALFLMIGTHLESIFWIPTIFLLPYIFPKELKFERGETVRFLKLTVLGILLSILFYLIIYIGSGRQVGGTTEALVGYFSSGPLRMMRNIWLSFARGFGGFTIPVLVFLLLKHIRLRRRVFVWLIFFASTAFIAANWQGDFMPRRIVFAALILSLALYEFLKKKAFLVVLYLIPIVLMNVILYSRGSPFQNFSLPSGQVLIQTHYLAPFTKYDGTILWVDGGDLGKVDDHLQSGGRAFLARDAVTAPYRLLVGNNYHTTSLGRVGESESRNLFRKYKIEVYGDVLELKLISQNKIASDAGEPVIFYDTSFWGRLSRRRIDYGDLASWIWAIIVNHRDPVGWTYKDATGIWYN